MPAQTARQQDPNGFLLVKGCPISSYGVFQYSADQVGLPGDPNRIVNVYRPESAINDPQFLESLQNIPLINDHEMLSGFDGDESATPPEKYGVDGVLYDVGYAQPWVRGNLKMFSRSMQNDLNNGKKDLSLGYTCDFLMQDGTYDGTPYEVVQTTMRGNHLALVGAGRVPGAKVLDGRNVVCYDHLDFNSPQKESQMAKRKAMDSDAVANLRAQLKALLPAFEQFLNEEQAEPEHAAAQPTAAAATEAADPTAATPVAPTPALAPAAQPAVAEPAPAATQPSGAAPDPAALLAQLEEICQQLRSLTGGGEGGEGGESEGDQGGEEGVSDPTSQANPDEQNREGDQMPEELNQEQKQGDAVQGLAEDPNSHKLNVDSAEESGATGEQGRASPGPAAGKHTGADAATRAVYADIAAKTKLYDRLSKVVGAFDAAIDIQTATAADVAQYGIKKLKLTAPKGQEAVVLDSYLKGVESARQPAPTRQAVAADAASEVPAIAAYFKE
jgi:uncharacterized protein